MPPSAEGEGEEEVYHGHAIVVKGEYDLSRPSSQDGTMSGPELEPLVNQLLAQMNPQHLESPEPLEDLPSTNFNNSNNHHPYATPQSHQPAQSESKSRQRPNAPTMEERLQQMQEKRPLPWRPGVEPGADNETGGESRRKQIRFGCLLATRGEVQTVPCNSCANGRGKFDVCVALEGFFKGACASCQLSGRPNRCSIKQIDDVAESSPHNTPGGVPLNNGQDPTLQRTPSDGPKPKRRRKNNAVPNIAPNPPNPPNPVPDWESQRPQWEQELGNSHVQHQMKDIVQRPWATVNPTAPAQTPPMMLNGANSTGSGAPNSIERPSPLGWATVNQHSPPAGGQIFGNGEGGNGGSYQLSAEQREETVVNDDGSTALIDTLPKHKQRQVYGLVSGLQGGIEHLQKELNSLKRALGIDD
ncbi:uncharacterized protein BP5553_06339 [Venustampulla echinocandica]|uniref:Uncharacterized protein n=1 Tax=Venustampulla echinocandica TaxID=2656787 RepID=A0A370TJN0_9HELO|nr:uncharacterized protein BP5553_06339 [Venustampulla echinocandica]RDL35727.1 hypothetical protein BP5553_06339 [Venustampulla echinocandica]